MAPPKKSDKKVASGRTKRPSRVGPHAQRSEKLQQAASNFVSSKKLIVIVVAVALVILGSSGIYLWYSKMYSDPERVFWSMVDNNLAIKSVTKNVNQSSSAVKTIDTNQMFWNSQPMLHGVKNLTYNTSKPPTKLVLETISTPQDDYQRYALISRPLNGSKKADYSKIYNFWIKDGGNTPTGTSSTYSQTIFGAVFFGNFYRAQRAPLVQQLRSAYTIDYGSTTKTNVNGRKTYIYNATVNLQKYAIAAHSYASLLNLPGADNISAKSFSPTDRLKAKFTVDVLSKQVMKIEYINNNVTENYSGFGLASDLKIPDKITSKATFQKALEAASK